MTHTPEQAIQLMKEMSTPYVQLVTSKGNVGNSNLAKITYKLLTTGYARTSVCKNRQQKAYGMDIVKNLKKVGIDATLQNDAPRGGVVGDFIKLN